VQRIGIDFITVFGMPPVDFVHLAADLNCRDIGIALAPMFATPLNYPAWSLRDDPALRRDVTAALVERGVSVSLGEGFLIRPGGEIGDSGADLDVMRELGAKRINMCSIDPDLGRSFDQCARLAEMADARCMETTLEFGPIFAIPDLATALAARRHVGRPTFRLLVDTLHLARAGLSAQDLAALPSGTIGYAQLCDAPLAFTQESYMNEARFERMVPGEGELPLAAIVAALPSDIVIGLEIPMLRQAQTGVDAHRRVGRCVEAARNLLEFQAVIPGENARVGARSREGDPES
jgi:sugar phosphate isomerase/epimerase